MSAPYFDPDPVPALVAADLDRPVPMWAAGALVGWLPSGLRSAATSTARQWLSVMDEAVEAGSIRPGHVPEPTHRWVADVAGRASDLDLYEGVTTLVVTAAIDLYGAVTDADDWRGYPPGGVVARALRRACTDATCRTPPAVVTPTGGGLGCVVDGPPVVPLAPPPGGCVGPSVHLADAAAALLGWQGRAPVPMRAAALVTACAPDLRPLTWAVVVGNLARVADDGPDADHVWTVPERVLHAAGGVCADPGLWARAALLVAHGAAALLPDLRSAGLEGGRAALAAGEVLFLSMLHALATMGRRRDAEGDAGWRRALDDQGARRMALGQSMRGGMDLLDGWA